MTSVREAAFAAHEAGIGVVPPTQAMPQLNGAYTALKARVRA